MSESSERNTRTQALRRAWRTFWWMVVRRRGYTPGLSRRTYAGIAFREARCGLMTGGAHAWGPLHYEYEGARWRKRRCRWCGASLTPAEEIAANPPSEEDQERMRRMVRKPTDTDVEEAMESARRAGIFRDGKFLWE